MPNVNQHPAREPQSRLGHACAVVALACACASAAAQSADQRWPGAARQLRAMGDVRPHTGFCCKHAKPGVAKLSDQSPGALSAPGDPTDVLHYRLELELFPAEARLEGVCTIHLRANADLQTLRLRLSDQLAVHAVTSGGIDLALDRVDTRTIDLELPQGYSAGDEFDVVVSYGGNPIASGLGSIMFQNTADGPLAYSLSESAYAYTWWPAKDGTPLEPAENTDRASVETWVTAPESMRSLGAGVLQGVDALSGGRSRYRWATDAELSAYQVFFASGPYHTWTQSFDHADGQMPVEFNVLPSLDTPELRADWESSLDMLGIYSEMFGPYPFLDQKYGIYSFGYAGGSGHPTSVGQSSYGFQQTAHQLAHQWWGAAVTPRHWADVWLSEGFASYSEALLFERFDGPADPNRCDYWMNTMRPGAQWLGLPVYRSGSAVSSAVFSPVVFNKGAWVLHMLRLLVGDAAFFDILSQYRAQYEGGVATTQDFAAVASQVSGQELGWFFDQWVYRAGGPRFVYGWRRERIGGREYVFLSVDQNQIAAYGVFRVPLQVRLEAAAGFTEPLIWSDQRREHYVLPVDAKVNLATLDPRKRVLKQAISRGSYLAGPPKLLTTSPAPGSFAALSQAAAELKLQFSERLSALGTVEVRDAGGNLHPGTLSYDPSTYRATFRFGQPLAPGRYNVVVGDGFSSLAAAQKLDGEIGSADAPLPSGDGQPGGACQFGLAILEDCDADIDASGRVDLSDLLIVLGRFGLPAASPGQGDLTGDGQCSLDDLLFMLSVYGRACP